MWVFRQDKTLDYRLFDFATEDLYITFRSERALRAASVAHRSTSCLVRTLSLHAFEGIPRGRKVHVSRRTINYVILIKIIQGPSAKEVSFVLCFAGFRRWQPVPYSVILGGVANEVGHPHQGRTTKIRQGVWRAVCLTQVACALQMERGKWAPAPRSILQIECRFYQCRLQGLSGDQVLFGV